VLARQNLERTDLDDLTVCWSGKRQWLSGGRQLAQMVPPHLPYRVTAA